MKHPDRKPRTTTESPPSRRAVLKGGMLAAGAAASPTFAWTPGIPTYHNWLLERVTFGRTPEMEAELETRGWEGFLDWQLDWTAIDDSAAETQIASLVPIVGMTPLDIYSTWFLTPQVPRNYASALPVLRGWLSKRQLLHVMADFWTNVFSRYVVQAGQETGYAQYDERCFYGPSGANGLGDFSTVLRASAEGGSMNFYLNQWLSDAVHPIENYTRELLELHTLGTFDDGTTTPFSETDVAEGSKVFTGWSIDFTNDPALFGEFKFQSLKHSPGTKTVYGTQYPDGGVVEGQSLLADLAASPRAAAHIARRLTKWFLMEDPPNWLIAKVRNAMLSSGGDLKVVVRELFSKQTYDHLTPDDLMVRRPLHLGVALLRALSPDLTGLPTTYWTDYDGLLDGLEKMGQRPGYWPAPDGYPAELAPWIASLQPRLEFVDDLCHNRIPGLDLSATRLDDLFGSTPSTAYASKAAEILTGGTLPSQHVSRIQLALRQIWLIPGYSGDLRREALALTASAPTHQYLY